MLFGANAQKNRFPDGSKMSTWFSDFTKTKLENLGQQYIITEHGVKNDSTLVQTVALQAVINKAAETGGVVVIPRGTFLLELYFLSQRRIFTCLKMQN